MMKRRLRALVSVVTYCLVFLFLLLVLYPVLLDGGDRREVPPWEAGPGAAQTGARVWGRRGHPPNVVDQRQVLGLYEDNQSPLSKSRSPEKSSVAPSAIIQDCPQIPPQLQKYIPLGHSVPLTDREKLLAMCRQTEIVSLPDLFTETMVATMSKIGEGAFADVFGCQGDDWRKLALKILPVGGDFKYNDEEQSSLKTVQPEIVVTLELAFLGDSDRLKNTKEHPHFTTNFMQVERVSYSKGLFPDYLLEAWDDYDYRKNSDNDRPDIFPEDQEYIVFVVENSGMQLGSYVYHSFDEAISILTQVSLTLAVGEEALQFEHRDLHRGNVLVRRTKEETIYFRLGNKDYHIKSHGVRATIVDYTLSRVTQRESHCLSHQDLENMPWLFKGKGDIQFEVYRNMKNATRSDWRKFNPYTNVLWINYLATKTKIKGKLKNISGRVWESKFKPYLRGIVKCSSSKEVFLTVFNPAKPLRTRPSHEHNQDNLDSQLDKHDQV